MKSYIEREATIETVKKERNYTGKFTFEEEHAWAVGFQQGITFALSDIAAIPTADVRLVVKAYWIGEGDGYADGEMVYDVWSCSNCGYTVDEGDNEPPRYNFCPNCGAKMEAYE